MGAPLEEHLQQNRYQKRRTGFWKRTGVIATSFATAVGMTLGGATAGVADDGEHRSHAHAELIDADLLGLNLANAISAEQTYGPADQDAQTGTINAEVIEKLLALDLEGISLPILGDGLTVGATSAYANAPSTTKAVAAAGAVNENGAIDVSGIGEYGYAKVNLTDALDQLGVSLDGVVDNLGLELGAVASKIEKVDGVVTPDYTLAGARLALDAPILGDVTTLLTGTDENAGLVGELDTAVNGGVLGPEGAVQRLLDGLGATLGSVDVSLVGLPLVKVDLGAPKLNASVPVETLVTGLLNEPLVSESGLTTVDLQHGQIYVDLEAVHPDGLNGLSPGTEILSTAVLKDVVDEVNDLLKELVNNIATTVDTALAETKIVLSLEPAVTALLLSGDIGITIETTVKDLLRVRGNKDEEVLDPKIDISGALTILGLGEIPLDRLLGGLTEPLLERLVPALTGSVADELGTLGTVVSDLVAGTTTPLLDAASPVTDLLELVGQVASITVNDQSAPGNLGEGSFSVSALTVNVLPGADVVSLPLATSTVYAENTADFKPELSVTPDATVAEGDTVISGTGFVPGSTVNVAVTKEADENDEDVVPVHVKEGILVGPDGNFPMEWKIPAGTDPGTLNIIAVDTDNEGIHASGSLEIVAPVISVPQDVTAGEPVVITGEGFVRGSQVNVQIGEEETITSVPVNGDGEFTATWAEAIAGTHSVVATDTEREQVTASAELEVGESDADADVAADTDTNIDTDVDAADADTTDTDVDALDVDSATDTDVDATDTDGVDSIDAVDTDVDVDVDSTDVDAVTDTDVPDVDGTDVDTADADVDVDAVDADTTDTDVDALDVDSATDTDVDATDTDDVDSTDADADSTDATDAADTDTDATDGDEDAELDTVLTVDPEEVKAGGVVTIVGGDFASETTVEIVITDQDGNVVDSFEVTTNENGNFTNNWTVPVDVEAGPLTVTATDVEDNSAEAALMVTEASDVDSTDADSGTDTDVDVDAADVDSATDTDVDATDTDDVDSIDAADTDVDVDVDSTDVDAATDTDAPDVDGTDTDTADADVDAADADSTDATDGVDADADAGIDATDTDSTDTDADADAVDTDATDAVDTDVDVDVDSTDVDVDGADIDAATDTDVEATDTDDVDSTDADADSTDATDADDTDTDATDGDEDVKLDTVLTVDPDEVKAGDVVTIEGEDFASETNVEIVVTDKDGNIIASFEVVTDEDGNFTTDWTVPADIATGQMIVTVTDAEGNSAQAELLVLPSSGETDADADADADAGAGEADAGETGPAVTVDPDTIAPGENLTIDGSGFESGENVTVEIVDTNGNVIDSIEVVADEHGNFVVYWTAPEDLAAGEYNVVVTDSSGDTYVVQFTVTGTSGGSGLATTGANSTLLTTGVALLLMMLGTALFMVRRNRTHKMN